MTQLTEAQLKKVISELKDAQSFQAGAWSRVIKEARNYALMQAHCRYIEPNGSVTHIHKSEQKTYADMFASNLLRAAETAVLEDALAGQALQKALS